MRRNVLPADVSKYSKHTFTQPQLMALLRPMRLEDSTLREAELRLAAHSDPCRALFEDADDVRPLPASETMDDLSLKEPH